MLKIHRGKKPAPDRILMVGTEGVGKSTFASHAPNPVFIAAEDGIRHLNVASVEGLETFEDTMTALADLATEDHDFKTVVIDTVDWLEPLLWRSVCEKRGWMTGGQPDIEKPGYGKGFAAANEEWRKFIVALAKLRNERQMEIILLAHCHIKIFSDPAGNDFSRYESKLAKGASAILREWCDSNLFATHEQFTREVDGKVKGFSSGNRIIHTTRAAAWDAKNRYDLPEILPLSYEAYSDARASGSADKAASLLEEAKTLIPKIDPAKHESIQEALSANAADVRNLLEILRRMRDLAAQKEIA